MSPSRSTRRLTPPISVVLGSEYNSSILSDDAMRVLAAGESLIAPNGCVASTKSPS